MAAGKSMFELSKKLLGLEGSTVTISMQRVTDNSYYSLTMVRKETIRKSGACSGGERSRRRISPFALRVGTVRVRVRVHGPLPAASEAECWIPGTCPLLLRAATNPLAPCFIARSGAGRHGPTERFRHERNTAEQQFHSRPLMCHRALRARHSALYLVW